MSDALSHDVCRGPSTLKIKATRHPIDVEHLSCKIEGRMGTAGKGVGMDGRQGDTATGDKFVAEGGSPCNGIKVVDQDIAKTVQVLDAEVTPTLRESGLLAEILPEA